MITFNLIVCISTVLITNVSGNMFSPFSSFPGFPSFPSFSNPFGSSYGSPFGSGYPFAQSYGQPIFASDDPFSAPFPFQQSSSPFFTPSQTSTAGGAKSASSVPSSSSSSSPFPSPFSRGFGPFGFPSFPSFPSFADFTKGLASGDLKGNGFTVTTSTSGGNKAGGNSPGQVIQTIKVEKIGTENGPGEERRIVQTIRASGPLITSSGSNLHQGSRGNNQSARNQRRPTGPRPIKLNNNQFNAQQNVSQQQRKPLRPLRPTTTPILPPTGLKINGTQSTSSQQSTVLNNSAGKPTISNNNQQQLLIDPGNIGTGTSSKLSSSSSSSSLTTAGNSIGVNKSSQSTVGGSQNLKVNSAGGSGITSFQSVNSDQSATAKSGGGVTVKRVDSSGRIINGF